MEAPLTCKTATARQKPSMIKILTYVLVISMLSASIQRGAEFVECARPRLSVDASPGPELPPGELPPPAAEVPGIPLSGAALRVRPIVQHAAAQVRALVAKPEFAALLRTDRGVRNKIVTFLELLDKYFLELYGVHIYDTTYISFFSAARKGTLANLLENEAALELLVVYLQVAAGDMGGDEPVWPKPERTFPKYSFANTLATLRQSVAKGSLLSFLEKVPHQYLFYKFFLSFLRRTAAIKSPLLPFDKQVTDRLRLGHLADDLRDKHKRAALLSMLQPGNSVLTELPPAPAEKRPGDFKTGAPQGESNVGEERLHGTPESVGSPGPSGLSKPPRCTPEGRPPEPATSARHAASESCPQTGAGAPQGSVPGGSHGTPESVGSPGPSGLSKPPRCTPEGRPPEHATSPRQAASESCPQTSAGAPQGRVPGGSNVPSPAPSQPGEASSSGSGQSAWKRLGLLLGARPKTSGQRKQR